MKRKINWGIVIWCLMLFIFTYPFAGKYILGIYDHNITPRGLVNCFNEVRRIAIDYGENTWTMDASEELTELCQIDQWEKIHLFAEPTGNYHMEITIGNGRDIRIYDDGITCVHDENTLDLLCIYHTHYRVPDTLIQNVLQYCEEHGTLKEKP